MDEDSDDDGSISSDLFVINLSCLQWWKQPILGGAALGRIDPDIVMIGSLLFIFGGYQTFEGDGGPLSSYSVARITDEGNWEWDQPVVPYPADLNPSVFGHARPIFNDEIILP